MGTVCLVWKQCDYRDLHAHCLSVHVYSYGYSGVQLPTCLAGSSSRQRMRRMRVYRTMLRAMTDEQRFTVAARLTHGVLGGVVDGALTVSDEASVCSACTHPHPSRLTTCTASDIPTHRCI